MQPFATPPEFPAEDAALDGATLAGNRANTASESGEIAPLEMGTRVGPYEVRAHLGDGGMASVYRAWHTNLHREEALKIPRQQGRFGPEAAFVRRLLAEARTVAGLHHPNIATIHAVSEADAPLQYFSMELVGGGDLAQLLEERGSLSAPESLPILEQIAAALDYAHANGVIHRDIKPANVLLGSDGNAKVVDFGISRAGEELGGTRLTRTGMIVGTPEYMSPEQSGSGEAVSKATDIYSLGVVAYEMLCGAPPFVAGDGVNRLSILMKHVGEAPEPPLRRAPDLPQAAGAVVLKALAKKPSDRPATCREFVSALAEALEGAALRGGFRGRRARAATAMRAEGRPTTRALSGADNTLEMEAAVLKAKQVLRLTTLLAGIGGLFAGAMIFGWLGRSEAPPVIPAVVPQRIVAPLRAVAPSATPRPQAPAPKMAVPKPATKQKRIETRSEAIAFARQSQPDAKLARGQKKTVQRGENGTREVRTKIVAQNGKILSRRVLSQRIVRPARAEIVAFGTRAPAVARPQPTPRATAKVQAKTPIKTPPAAKRAAPVVTKRRAKIQSKTRRASPPRRTVPKRRIRNAPRRIKSRTSARAPRRRPSRGGDAPLPP